MNFSDKKNIYMIGIKGVGMSMLAQFLQGHGFNISGSDVAEFFPSDRTLTQAKIKVKSGFSLQDFPKKIDLIIYSSAFNEENNIEMEYFANQDIPKLSYAQALGFLQQDYFGISVCGSHGKTTVTAWLGYVLDQAGLSPNVLSGSYVKQFSGSSLSGTSKYLILESDEYQNKLKYLHPQAIVLNNISFDHPDYFKSPVDYLKVFSDFIARLDKSGFLINNLEDENSSQILNQSPARIISYYIDQPIFNSKVQYEKIYQARNCQIGQDYQSFDLFRGDEFLTSFKIYLPGRHNILNALAVISTALELGLGVEEIKGPLWSFKGPARRFDVLGTYQGALIIDDYAHHPQEIQASLQAIKERYPDKRIVCLFHPHTFSRTEAFLDDFARSFTLSDVLYLVEIYASAREKKSELSSLDLIDKIRQYNETRGQEQELGYFKDLDQAEKELVKKITNNDLVLLLGAGDVFRVAYNWLDIKIMKYLEGENLRDYTTFKIGGPIKFLVKVQDKSELFEALDKAEQEKWPLLILGSGSNILASDQGFSGLVIKNEIKGLEIISENDSEVIIRAQSGEIWSKLVKFTVDRNLYGLENTFHIPGTVGAAPIQNIGAYGTELKNCLVSLKAINLKTKEEKEFSASDCELAYRDSIFKNELKGQYFILSLDLRLKKNGNLNLNYPDIQRVLTERKITEPSLSDLIEIIREIRDEKLPNPGVLPSAGSFFKNPIISSELLSKLQDKFSDLRYFVNGDEIKIPAGWMIEKCGFKDRDFGSVGVHKKQALILVNYGGAKQSDVLALAQKIKEEVKDRFNISLEEEVNII